MNREPPDGDTQEMRQLAISGVLGGWVYGTTERARTAHRYEDGRVECLVTVTVPAESYERFLAEMRLKRERR